MRMPFEVEIRLTENWEDNLQFDWSAWDKETQRNTHDVGCEVV